MLYSSAKGDYSIILDGSYNQIEHWFSHIVEVFSKFDAFKLFG